MIQIQQLQMFGHLDGNFCYVEVNQKKEIQVCIQNIRQRIFDRY